MLSRGIFDRRQVVSVASMTLRLSRRARLAIAAVNAVNALSRHFRRGSGTVAGGRAGLTILPTLLTELSRGRTVILVSGTNGKTTTSALLRSGWGTEVAGNETGANMPAGHVAALCASPAAHVVLETDEAWLASVVHSTEPAVVILLNLSRDQLDRANEVRQLAQRWRDCFSADDFSGVVVANASDPLVVFAAQTCARVRWVDVPTAWRADAASCPHCTRALHYAHHDWSCECGFTKPTGVSARLRSFLEIGNDEVAMELALPGDFNQVNAALAVTALSELGIGVQDALTRMRTLRQVQGRYGLRTYHGSTLLLLLAKNPAGTAALLESLDAKEVWVAINSRVADGKDPSWLYDVAFDSLKGRHVRCLGERRVDLATRLLYGGVDCDIVDDEEELLNAQASVTLIANYTAFQEWMARTIAC